jgi:hypothetical protein
MSDKTGGPAFPGFDYIAQDGKKNPEGMTLRDYFAAQVQADDLLVKCIRAMDDTALAIFALHPTAEREEHIKETGMLYGEPEWLALDEVGKVTARLLLEAKAIARVRYMQADAMLQERAK